MSETQTYAARIRTILHDAVDAQGTNGVRYVYGFSDAKSAAALIAAEADAKLAEAEKRIGELEGASTRLRKAALPVPPHGTTADLKMKMANVAICIMRSTLVVREWNGKGRPKVYRDGIDAIAGAARQLAGYAIEHAGFTITTGIFIETWEGTWQVDRCVCCGKPVSDHAPMFLIDRDTCEVLPDRAEFCERGKYWPIGSECLKRYPGIERYAVCDPAEPPPDGDAARAALASRPGKEEGGK
jgi:hypothetical protein